MEIQKQIGNGAFGLVPTSNLGSHFISTIVDQPWYRLHEYIRKVLGEWRKVNLSDLLHLAEGLVSVCLEQPT